MKKHKLSIAVSLVIAGGPAMVNAQEQVSEQYDGRMVLEEVQVTAERRALSIQDTPSSVVAISEEDLKGKNIESVDDLQAYVPNLSIGGTVPTGQAGPEFSIRGISSAHGRIGAEKGVALYIDDLYYPHAVGSLLRLIDVERVEVLRGPQGTLFGRNATGGAVRYISRKPSDEFEANISASLGTSDRTDMVGLINIPFSDTIALRAQFGSWEQDGYIDLVDENGDFIQDSGSTDDTAARAVLRLNPTDALTVDLGLSHIESKGTEPTSIVTEFYKEGLENGDPVPVPAFGPFGSGSVQVAGYQAYLVNNGLDTLTAGDASQVSPDNGTRIFSCYLDDAANVTPIEGDYIAQQDYCRLGNSVENTIASVDINYELSDQFSIRYLGGMMEGDAYSSDILFGNIFSRFTVTEMESQSHELQLNYTGEKFSGIIGYYFFNETPSEHTGQREFLAFGPAAGTVVSAAEDFNELETTTNAIFAQLNVEVTDRLSTIVGVRYSEDDKTTTLGDYNVGTGGLLALADADNPQEGAIDYDGDGILDAYKGSATFDSFDWRLTGQYTINGDAMAYGTISTGFKSGGFAADLVYWLPNPNCFGGIDPSLIPGNCTATDSPIIKYDQENVLNYELGLKADWFDGRFRTNVALYLMQYEDMIVQHANFEKPTSGRPELLMLNAGDADIYGFEADASLLVTGNLTLNFSIGNTDIDWQSLSPYTELYDEGSCPAVAFEEQNLGDCDTLDLKYTPEWSYTLGANYVKPLENGSELSFRLNYGWTDETESNNGSNSWRSDAYGLTSLRAQWDAPEHWSVALFGSNIFDEEYSLSGLRQNGGNPAMTDSYIPGRGAEWGLSVDYRY